MAAEEDRVWREALKGVPRDTEVTFQEGKKKRSLLAGGKCNEEKEEAS